LICQQVCRLCSYYDRLDGSQERRATLNTQVALSVEWSGVDTRPSVYHIQACLEIDIDNPCRLWLWNEAALAVLACAPKAFFAAERVSRRAKKPPDRQENKRRKLI